MCHCGSSYTYLPKSKMQYCRDKKSGKAVRNSAAATDAIADGDVDANMLRVDISTLEDIGTYSSGEPFRCLGCGSIFSFYGKHHVTQEGLEKIWVCEFCLTKNKFSLDEAGYPTNPIAIYIINPKEDPEENKLDQDSKKMIKKSQKIKSLRKKQKEDLKQSQENIEDQTVIFCIEHKWKHG